MALTHRQVSAAVDSRHWRIMLQTVRATFTSHDYHLLATFVQRISAVAEDLDHHPDVLLRWGRVVVTTSSHDVGGLTSRDVELAKAVSAIAEELGLGSAAPSGQALEVAIDALDRPAVARFWAAVLRYTERSEGEGDITLVDPDGVGVPFWFQQMETPRPERSTIHIDVTVAHDDAEARVAAALAAGGHLVSDADAPAFWVLADVEGNEACVSTWLGRDDD